MHADSIPSFDPVSTRDPVTMQRWAAARAALPLVAILRGVRPEESVAVAQALHGAGFRLIEVPLNSPEPLRSIDAIRAALPEDALVGAGTVLTLGDVQDVRAAGGELIVMPHADVQVIAAARTARMVCVPGFSTPTEAFAALQAGADALKLFPAEAHSPASLRAVRAVIGAADVFPVGGITSEGMGPWRDAGAAGFGLGSALYRPGMSPGEVGERARAFVAAWRGTLLA